MQISPATPWINVQGQLSECPIWHRPSQTLYWTDINAGHLYRHDWAAGTSERIYEGEKVGGYTFQSDNSLLLFRVNDIARFRPGGEAESIIPFDHEGSVRLNDVAADPAGRVFAGTIGKTKESGGLFRIDRDGSVTQVAGGTGCSNGIAFSPAEDRLYWVCSTRKRIHSFPYDKATGCLGEPTILFQGDDSDGYPDGLTVDSEGNLYNIRWTAAEYGLMIFSPDGKVLHRQALPPRASSSLTFCGPDLRQLAITSAADKSDPDREADLYLIRDLPIAGREEYRSAVLL